MASPPPLREMLDALAAADVLAAANALGVYQEVVDDMGPETALYQGLVEAEIMSDVDVELAVVEDAPIRLIDDEPSHPIKEPTCRHTKSGPGGHCREMVCSNYINKCPQHGTPRSQI